MLLEKIEKYVADYDVIPVKKEIYADLVTPIALLQKIAAKKKRFYLLESVEGGEKWGRYSFLGYDPVMRVSCFRDKVEIEEKGEKKTITTNDSFHVIRDILKKYRSPKIEDMPPFTGGFVGYFAYAMIEHAEPVLNIKRGEFNDYDLMLFDKVIAYDQLKQKIIVVGNVKTKGDLQQNLQKAEKEIDDIITMIQEETKLPEFPSYDKVKFECNVSEKEYEDIVEKTKEYIRDGDIFQAVISRRFVSPYEGSLIQPYRVLRTTNSSPYMVYMNLDDVEIMSTSPETLVR